MPLFLALAAADFFGVALVLFFGVLGVGFGVAFGDGFGDFTDSTTFAGDASLAGVGGFLSLFAPLFAGVLGPLFFGLAVADFFGVGIRSRGEEDSAWKEDILPPTSKCSVGNVVHGPLMCDVNPHATASQFVDMPFLRCQRGTPPTKTDCMDLPWLARSLSLSYTARAAVCHSDHK